MKYTAEINIMPHPDLPDYEGGAIAVALKQIPLAGIEALRVGKHVQLFVDAAGEAEARELVDAACKHLLVNPQVETYLYSLTKREE